MFEMCEKNSSRQASVRERYFHLGARDRKVVREPESGGRALLPCPMAHATRHARAVSRARAIAARTPKSFPALCAMCLLRMRRRLFTRQRAQIGGHGDITFVVNAPQHHRAFWHFPLMRDKARKKRPEHASRPPPTARLLIGSVSAVITARFVQWTWVP